MFHPRGCSDPVAYELTQQHTVTLMPGNIHRWESGSFDVHRRTKSTSTFKKEDQSSAISEDFMLPHRQHCLQDNWSLHTQTVSPLTATSPHDPLDTGRGFSNVQMLCYRRSLIPATIKVFLCSVGFCLLSCRPGFVSLCFYSIVTMNFLDCHVISINSQPVTEDHFIKPLYFSVQFIGKYRGMKYFTFHRVTAVSDEESWLPCCPKAF